MFLKTKSFFLGANTPEGFFSLFNELYNPEEDWNVYIIKGGPGTGKSSLMKKVAREADKRGYTVEYIPCSSDPLSLDGIIIEELKIAVADGTSPHTINPVYPGVCEHTIDLGQFWDSNKLKSNNTLIKKITTENSGYHKQCVSYLKTLSLINNELNHITNKYFIKEKADRFIYRFCKNYLSNTDNNYGFCKYRFLSTVTPSGITVQYDTIFNMCDNIITISDNSNIISDYILKNINKYFDKNKIDRILCMCPTDPRNKIDHIIFPVLRLGVFTSNTYHPMINKNGKIIRSERFIDNIVYNDHKNKIKFLNSAKVELIEESVRCLKKAKASHDILESYYISAMDFNRVSAATDDLIKKIFL